VSYEQRTHPLESGGTQESTMQSPLLEDGFKQSELPTYTFVT
jgi:hypothetical protein